MSTKDDITNASDARLKSPLPSSYSFKPLPKPANKDAIVKVSAIPTSKISGPKNMFTAFAKAGEQITVPAWSFLIEHGDDSMLWDLGLREDPENSTPRTKKSALSVFTAHPAPGPIKQLQDGGYDLSELKTCVLSHKHFDHTGNISTLPKQGVSVLLGGGTLASVGRGAPEDPDSVWPSSWLKEYHMAELPIKGAKNKPLGSDPLDEHIISRFWEQLGCFDDACDWYSDGSLWFIDTPGHCDGHLMALARVTYDPPTYILLAGDAAHDQSQYLPIPEGDDTASDKRSPIPFLDGKAVFVEDVELAARTIGQMTRMSVEENVMVLMAHEAEAEGVVPTFPDDLARWQAEGWKEKKETARH